MNVVATAKLLAEGLAKRDEQEKKQKEDRRQRLEEKIDAADRQMESIRNGKTGAGQGRLDAEYVESKELVEEKTREAVLAAMRLQAEKQDEMAVERTGSESSIEEDAGDASGGENADDWSSASSEDADPLRSQAVHGF